MEQFSMLDPGRTGELNMVRNGWFNPFYTLTDGINTYGKLSYQRFWRKTGNVEALGQNWIIEPQGLFKRDIFVKDQLTAQTITIIKTSLWRVQVSLKFPDGHIFEFKRDTIFSKTQYWYNQQYGNILSIESRIWNTKQPFKIIPELNTPKNNINLVLLAFIGVHLILLRRAHAAAAH